MKKSLILIAALASVAVAGSESLEDAFKNGKFSGDITAWSESRHINKGQKSTYYANTSYIVGSIGLGYETDFYKNFRLVTGFRGAAPLYERHKNFRTLHGTGDSTERIYEHDRVLLSTLYLEWNAYDTSVKIGRQEMITDWIGRFNDGVRITNNSVSNLTLDLMRFGCVRKEGRHIKRCGALNLETKKTEASLTWALHINSTADLALKLTFCMQTTSLQAWVAKRCMTVP